MLSMRGNLMNLVKNASKLSGKNNFALVMTQSSSFSIKTKLQDKQFTQKHEWISLSGNVGTVGISEYAQDKLGEVVYMELPQKGTKYAKGDAFCTLESVKAVSECYMPVSGTIEEVNTPLTETPNLINKSPYDQGWLVKVKVDNKAEVDQLMSEAKYQEFLKTADSH